MPFSCIFCGFCRETLLISFSDLLIFLKSNQRQKPPTGNQKKQNHENTPPAGLAIPEQYDKKRRQNGVNVKNDNSLFFVLVYKHI